MTLQNGFPLARRRLLLAANGGTAANIPALAAGPVDAYAETDAVYEALKTQPHTTISVGGGSIDIVFADGAPGVDRARVMAWINKSAVAVSTYFGNFPVRQTGLLIVAQDGDRVGHGTTYGFDLSAIRMHVGRAAADDAFERDWVLVHEMVHLALPRVPPESLWVQEGNATYVEPLARAQAGQLDKTIVWRWSLQGMPKGEPGPGDRGLDRTPTWGRTYWGGAMFWLLADIEIYRRTQGRHSLQQALRAINRASGGNTALWPVSRVMATGDEATGTDALQSLYAKLKDEPVVIDLDGVFKQLGVYDAGDRIVFDDAAPLAALCRQMTQHR